MSAFPSLATVDRETSPLAHTFVPREKSEDVITWAERHATAAVGDKVFTAQKRASGVGKRKVRLKLAVPYVVTQTINGVNVVTVDDIDYVDCTFTLSTKRTDQDRKNLVGMFQGLLDAADANVVDMIVKDESVW